MAVASPLTTGLGGGRFYPKHGRVDLAVDQRTDDVGPLVFDGEPLAQPLDLLGAPVAEPEVRADQPQANVAVRLCHVGPAGATPRIRGGILNLTPSESTEDTAARHHGPRYPGALVLGDSGSPGPSSHP